MKDFTEIEARKLLESAREYSPGGDEQQVIKGRLVEVPHDDFLIAIGRDPSTTSTEEGMKLAEEYNGLREFKDYARFNYSAPKPNPIFYEETLKFCIPPKEIADVVSLKEHVKKRVKVVG